MSSPSAPHLFLPFDKLDFTACWERFACLHGPAASTAQVLACSGLHGRVENPAARQSAVGNLPSSLVLSLLTRAICNYLKALTVLAAESCQRPFRDDGDPAAPSPLMLVLGSINPTHVHATSDLDGPHLQAGTGWWASSGLFRAKHYLDGRVPIFYLSCRGSWERPFFHRTERSAPAGFTAGRKAGTEHKHETPTCRHIGSRHRNRNRHRHNLRGGLSQVRDCKRTLRWTRCVGGLASKWTWWRGRSPAGNAACSSSHIMGPKGSLRRGALAPHYSAA